MRSIYEAAGGDEGLLHLAEAWHSRVLADVVVGHGGRWMAQTAAVGTCARYSREIRGG